MFARQDFKGGGGGPTALSTNGNYVAVIVSRTSILLYRDLDNLLQPCGRYTRPPSINAGWSNQITWAENLNCPKGKLRGESSSPDLQNNDLVMTVISASRTHVCLFGSTRNLTESDSTAKQPPHGKSKRDPSIGIAGKALNDLLADRRISQLPVEHGLIRKLIPALLLSFPLAVHSCFQLSTVAPQLLLLFAQSPTVALMSDGQTQISAFLHLPFLRVCESACFAGPSRATMRSGSLIRSNDHSPFVGSCSVDPRRRCDGTNCDRAICIGLRLADVCARGLQPMMNSPVFVKTAPSIASNEFATSLLQFLSVKQPKTTAVDRDLLNQMYGQRGVIWTELDVTRKWLYVLLCSGTLVGLSMCDRKPAQVDSSKKYVTSARSGFSFLRSKDDASRGANGAAFPPSNRMSRAQYDSRMIGRVLGNEDVSKLLYIQLAKCSEEILIIKSCGSGDSDAYLEASRYDCSEWWDNGSVSDTLFKFQLPAEFQRSLSSARTETKSAEVVDVCTPINARGVSQVINTSSGDELLSGDYELDNVGDASFSPRLSPPKHQRSLKLSLSLGEVGLALDQAMEKQSLNFAWSSDAQLLALAVRRDSEVFVACYTRAGDMLGVRHVADQDLDNCQTNSETMSSPRPPLSARDIPAIATPLLWNTAGTRLLVGLRTYVRIYEVVSAACLCQPITTDTNHLIMRGLQNYYEFVPAHLRLCPVAKPAFESSHAIFKNKAYYLTGSLDNSSILIGKKHDEVIKWWVFDDIHHDGQFGWVTDTTFYVIQDFSVANVSARFYTLALYQIEWRQSMNGNFAEDYPDDLSSTPKSTPPPLTIRFRGQSSPSLQRPTLISVLSQDYRWAKSDLSLANALDVSEEMVESLREFEANTPPRGKSLTTRNRAGARLNFETPAVAVYYAEHNTIVCFRIDLAKSSGKNILNGAIKQGHSELAFDCLYVARLTAPIESMIFAGDIFSFLIINKSKGLCLAAVAAEGSDPLRRPALYAPACLVVSSPILHDAVQIMPVVNSIPIPHAQFRATCDIDLKLCGESNLMSSQNSNRRSRNRSASTDSPLANRRLQYRDDSGEEESDVCGWNTVLLGGDRGLRRSTGNNSSDSSTFTDADISLTESAADDEEDNFEDKSSQCTDEDYAKYADVPPSLKERIRAAVEVRQSSSRRVIGQDCEQVFIGGLAFIVRTGRAVCMVELCLLVRSTKGSFITLRMSGHSCTLISPPPPTTIVLHADGTKDLLVMMSTEDPLGPNIQLRRFQGLVLRECMRDGKFMASQGSPGYQKVMHSCPRATLFDLLFYLMTEVISAIKRAASRRSSPRKLGIQNSTSMTELVRLGILSIGTIQRALINCAEHGSVVDLYFLLNNLLLLKWPLETLREVIKTSRVLDPLISPFVIFPLCQLTLPQAFDMLLVQHDLRTASAMLIPLQQLFGPTQTRTNYGCRLLIEAIIHAEPQVAVDIVQFIEASNSEAVAIALESSRVKAIEQLLGEKKLRAIILACTSLKLKLDRIFKKVSHECYVMMTSTEVQVLEDWARAIQVEFYIVDRSVRFFDPADGADQQQTELLLSDWGLQLILCAAIAARFTVLEEAVFKACNYSDRKREENS